MVENIFNYRDSQNAAPGHGNYCSQRCWSVCHSSPEAGAALSALTHAREKVQALSLPSQDKPQLPSLCLQLFQCPSWHFSPESSSAAWKTRRKRDAGAVTGLQLPRGWKAGGFHASPGEPRPGIPVWLQLDAGCTQHQHLCCWVWNGGGWNRAL